MRRTTTRSRLAKLNPCRRPRRPRTRRAVKIPGELPVCAPSSACLEREGEASAQPSSDESVEERQRLPRRREELTEEGDLPLERSKHVHRSHHQTTDCDARESGTCPDAAGHQTRQDQQAKRQPQQASQSQHKKWPPQQQSKTARHTPRRCCRSGHTRQDSRCPREEEPDKPMKNLASSCKNRRESGNGRPSSTGGTPAPAPGHRRLRDKGLHTLLGPTSGQPSCFHGPQPGRRSRESHA